MKGRGCSECMSTGYDGQTGIYELLKVTREIRELINQNADSTLITDKARRQGLRVLREDGLDKVLNGITTAEEIMRVTQDIEDMEEKADTVQKIETESEKVGML